MNIVNYSETVYRELVTLCRAKAYQMPSSIYVEFNWFEQVFRRTLLEGYNVSHI